jgi:hypothetical protein
MSPKTGVAFSETEEGRIGVTLQIKNQGVTPAHVTDVLITADTFPSSQTLPETPPYQRSHEVVPKAYLAPTTSLIFLPPWSFLTRRKSKKPGKVVPFRLTFLVNLDVVESAKPILQARQTSL